MSWVVAATVGSAVVGGYMASSAQKDAANTAAGAQIESAQMGINEQRRQFDAIQKLLSPYVSSGESALAGQLDLLGLNGPEAESAAIQRISSGEGFNAQVEQGENALRQNAAATGGLRGGNLQAALSQFRPQMLSSAIDSQFNKLGGITKVGQASAAGVGAAGQQTGQVIAGLYGDQGAAEAGAALAKGQADANMYGNIAGAIPLVLGAGGYKF
jgi:hypothetical protein